MRHNDYMIFAKCKQCGKPILVPRYWNSKKYDIPHYGTCNHHKMKEWRGK